MLTKGRCRLSNVWTQGCVDSRTCGAMDVWTQGCADRKTYGLREVWDSGTCELGDDVEFGGCGLGDVWT